MYIAMHVQSMLMASPTSLRPPLMTHLSLAGLTLREEQQVSEEKSVQLCGGACPAVQQPECPPVQQMSVFRGQHFATRL